MSAPAPRTPDDLLKWSIAAQNASGQGDGGESMQAIAQEVAEGRRPDLADPALYNALMGKSEAQMMKEELSAATDTTRSEQDRVQALDNFEMLIEQIDNANNMANMKMWEPIIALLTHPQSTPPIQHATLWIMGTAVQNNDKAQMAILDYEPLGPILELLGGSTEGDVRSKAMYALSGILKHNPKAVDLFGKAGGWVTLKGALLDSNVSLRRKAVFLVNTLLLQDDSATASEAAPGPPVGLLEAPPPGASPSPAPSRSTAIAPLDTPASTLPSAPLEQLPATLRSGVSHPSIPPLLVSSQLLDILILSLLPASLQSSIPATIVDQLGAIPTVGGPDGDVELREDIDYAEKGSQTCLTFVEKVEEQGGAARFPNKDGLAKSKVLLSLLVQELEGNALQAEEGVEHRWQELGLDKAAVDSFAASVKAL